jgi:hypothetical protein
MEALSRENTPAEIFVQVSLHERGDLIDSHVVTFDEIKPRPGRKNRKLAEPSRQEEMLD